jgi:hypothetical protein
MTPVNGLKHVAYVVLSNNIYQTKRLCFDGDNESCNIFLIYTTGWTPLNFDYSGHKGLPFVAAVIPDPDEEWAYGLQTWTVAAKVSNKY